MIEINRNGMQLFTTPRLFFTIRGQTESEHVLQELGKIVDNQFECKVCDSKEEIRAHFTSGLSPNSAVVLFDGQMENKCFSYLTASRADNIKIIPEWSAGAQWAVKIGKKPRPATCARQLAADFCRHFTVRLAKAQFPWGNPRKKEKPPVDPKIGKEINEVITRLNSGPDLAGSMAAQGHALELPVGSKISWIRVPNEPIKCEKIKLTTTLAAFEEFENVCDRLLRSDMNGKVQASVLAGVTIDSTMRNRYLYPRSTAFSIRRPDLHVMSDGVFASENDEMPGGFAELVHIDRAYGINQGLWEQCFNWLFEKGPVLFVVSHEWSKCYITEFRWLTKYLQEKGYPAFMRTTDDMEDVTFTHLGVYCTDTTKNTRIGTIWRQFPIFETKGKLAKLVEAAYTNQVRLVPEFAHFGNKVWFSIFRSHHDFFQKNLTPTAHQILCKVLPHSHLVSSPRSFPCVIQEYRIDSVDELKNLQPARRDNLVLKVCGANLLTARSYGVLMGHGLSQTTWANWIDERLSLGQSFIIQERLETSIETLPVMNTKRTCGEMFDCRLLLRPWVYNGDKLASVSACAVPSNTLRVHGRVDMAVVPVLVE